MRSRRSIRSSRRTSIQGGFSLIELLVALVLSGIVLSVAARDFGFTIRLRHDLDLFVETQHGLRAALGEITRELRQAGACLPNTGDFVAVGGVDDGEHDRLTVRIGKVDDDVACVRTVTTDIARQGTSVLTVQNAGTFELGEWVYLRSTSGSGQTERILSATSTSIQIEGDLDHDYPTGSGVFAIEEREYTIDTTGGRPVLTVAVDGEEPQPLVDGVEKLDVQYLLTPCPPCEPVDEPEDGGEWHQVREIAVRIGVVSAEPKQNGAYLRQAGTTNVKPRNLL